jgi:hypothetical protein
MIETILSHFSIKHDLYLQLKKHSANKIQLEDKDSVYLHDIFSFDTFKIKNQSYYTNLAYFSSTYGDCFQDIEQSFNSIFELKRLDKISIDISQLHGFSNSKSDLFKYQTIDQFVEKECPSYIDSITPEQLRLMLSHKGIQIIHYPDTSPDNFYMYGWQPKLFLSNENGSHHLAASQYIAKRLNQPVTLSAPLLITVLNGTQLANFHDRYAAFITPSDELGGYFKLFDNANLKFVRLDDSLNHYEVYFFKRTEENKRIISIFSSLFSSLNQILWKRLDAQSKNDLLRVFAPHSTGCWSF